MLNRELINFNCAGVNLQMAKFKVIISDPTDGKSKVIEMEEARAAPFIGKKLGETIDGIIVDMPATKLQILGGSDTDGVPMRGDVHGGIRRQVVLSSGAGFKPKREGERRRKTVRGNIITDEIVQINLKIVSQPAKPIENKVETTA
ncbi:MAG: 30S ribosomal protein S6e [Candidatus Bathyarchaeota archaeon]|nr:30S ribosomal protein S6e [Candidatus Termiticorpusculum sp.]